MNVTTLHRVSPVARASWKRAFIAGLAIVAVVMGLLAMPSPTVNSGTDQSQVFAASTVATVAASTDMSEASVEAEAPLLLETCAGSVCQAECLVIGVQCTLGSLTAAVPWLLHRGIVQRVVSSESPRVVSIIARRLSEFNPPSLVVLSISRT